jgi:hypothetical protein
MAKELMYVGFTCDHPAMLQLPAAEVVYLPTIKIIITYLLFDGRFGVVVGILAYYARGRGSRTMQTFVCMNMSVSIAFGCYGKKNYISMYLSAI